jgi:hypothetical protein
MRNLSSRTNGTFMRAFAEHLMGVVLKDIDCACFWCSDWSTRRCRLWTEQQFELEWRARSDADTGREPVAVARHAGVADGGGVERFLRGHRVDAGGSR